MVIPKWGGLVIPQILLATWFYGTLLCMINSIIFFKNQKFKNTSSLYRKNFVIALVFKPLPLILKKILSIPMKL